MRLNVAAEKPIIILTGLIFKFMKHSSGLFMLPGNHSIFPQSIHSPILLDNVFILPLPCVFSLTFHIQSLWDPVDLISNYIQIPNLSHYFHCHSSGLRYHYLPAFYLCSLSACLYYSNINLSFYKFIRHCYSYAKTLKRISFIFLTPSLPLSLLCSSHTVYYPFI